MIVQLRGEVVSAATTSFVLDCGGVGYGAHTTPGTASGLRVGEVTTVYTSVVIREDSHTLFAFATPAERDAFELVQSASSVGPRLAVAIISVLNVPDLKAAISSEDLGRLTTVPGIGKKTAQRIVLELKDKILTLDGEAPAPAVAASGHEGWREQVSEGLQSLGWSAKDAAAACDKIAHLAAEDESVSIAALMRAALSTLARR